MWVLASFYKDLGPSCTRALYNADELNGRRARQVCCHVRTVHAVCAQRKVRGFKDFPEISHLSDAH
jgi:hypothetical protein